MKRETVKKDDFDPQGSCKIWCQKEPVRYFGKPPVGFNTKYIQNRIRVPARTNQVKGTILDAFVIVLN